MNRYVIAINKAIEVVFGDQVCDRDQHGNRGRDQRSGGDRDEEGIEIVIGGQVCDCDQQGDRDRDQ